MKKNIALSLLITMASIQTVGAQPKVGIEIGVGSSFLPSPLFYEKTAISYRLPGNHFDLFLAANYQIIPVAKMGIDQLLAGSKYYFLTRGHFQPFVKLGGGWLPVRQGNFGILAGGGLDYKFNPNDGFHGLTLNLTTVVPPTVPELVLINADLNYKVSF